MTGTTGCAPAWPAASASTPRAARWRTTSRTAPPHPPACPLASAAEAITAWWSDPDTRRDLAPEPTRDQLDEALAASNRARPGGDQA